MQPGDETTKKAVVCGVGTIFIMGCLYFFGIPCLFVGASLIAVADGDSGVLAGGIVLLVLAVVMVIGGIITCFYTVKYGNKASAERRQRQIQAGVVHSAPGVMVYPATQPVAPPQYPGQPIQYTYAAAPPVGQYPPSTVSGLPEYPTNTAAYPDPSFPAGEYGKY